MKLFNRENRQSAAAAEQAKREAEQLKKLYTMRFSIAFEDVAPARLDTLIQTMRAFDCCKGYQSDGLSSCAFTYDTPDILALMSRIVNDVEDRGVNRHRILVSCQSVGLSEMQQRNAQFKNLPSR